jgi:hypothetical protein
MKELRNKLGEMEYDGLVAGLNPPVRVDGGTIGKLTEAAVLKRGKAEDTGLLSLYGGTGTPDCILCDDTEIGADEDVTTAVYKAGCFDLEKLTVAEGYTVTEADKDKLRERGIVFKSVSPAL